MSDSKSRFKTRFNPTLQLDRVKKYEIALVNLETYYSFPNIDESNNVFVFFPDNGTVYTEDIDHIFRLVKSTRIFGAGKSQYLSIRVLAIKIYLIIFYNMNGLQGDGVCGNVNIKSSFIRS